MKHINEHKELSQVVSLTQHAHGRLHERSIPGSAIKLLMTYADMRLPSCSSGCCIIMMSNAAIADALADGIPLKTVDRARGLQLVMNKNWEVVTAYKRDPNRRRLTNKSRRRVGAWHREMR
jgi:hypothetical protein